MYNNSEKLAKLLGIPKLPNFLLEEEFKYPAFDRMIHSESDQQLILSHVNEHMLPPATAEELLIVFELLKMGMHYVQHKTGESVERKFYIRASTISEIDQSLTESAFLFRQDSESYVITFPRLADFIKIIRKPDKYRLRSPHAPTMGLNPICDIVLGGAEEAHHAVTHRIYPEFHTQNHNGEEFPLPYFKDSTELAFGKFLPGLVSDFGFDVKQQSIADNLDALKGELSEEEYKQLYRERMEKRHGFKLPNDKEPFGRGS